MEKRNIRLPFFSIVLTLAIQLLSSVGFSQEACSNVLLSKLWELRPEYKDESTAGLRMNGEFSMVKWFSEVDRESFKITTSPIEVIVPKAPPASGSSEEYLEYLNSRSEKVVLNRLMSDQHAPLSTVRAGARAAIYVVNNIGQLLIHTRPENGKIHHSSLAGGESVLAAGDIHIENGEVVGITNMSGHYYPDANTLKSVVIPLLKRKGILTDYSIRNMKETISGWKTTLTFPKATEARIPETTMVDYYYLMGR